MKCRHRKRFIHIRRKEWSLCAVTLPIYYADMAKQRAHMQAWHDAVFAEFLKKSGLIDPDSTGTA